MELKENLTNSLRRSDHLIHSKNVGTSPIRILHVIYHLIYANGSNIFFGLLLNIWRDSHLIYKLFCDILYAAKYIIVYVRYKYFFGYSMELLLDGNSEKDAHWRSDLGCLIYLGQVKNLFVSEKNLFSFMR